MLVLVVLVMKNQALMTSCKRISCLDLEMPGVVCDPPCTKKRGLFIFSLSRFFFFFHVHSVNYMRVNRIYRV